MAEMYNLIWVPSKDNTDLASARATTNRYDLGAKETIILYPSLCTPEIVVGKNNLELILISKQNLTEADINEHLKICPQSAGLDVYKSFHKEPIYTKEQLTKEGNITSSMMYLSKVLHADKNKENGIIKIIRRKLFKGSFSGLVDERIVTYLLEKRNYKFLYHVLLPSRTMKMKRNLDEKLNKEVNNMIVAKEQQDIDLVLPTLNEFNGKKIENRGTHCFGLSDNSLEIDITKQNFKNPIQSYHPVFYFDKMDYANIGHFADPHLSSRQQILSKSNARVIECTDKNEISSPKIGKIMNNYSRNMKELLDKMGKDDAINVVVIGGDLIDCILGSYKNKKEFDSIKNAGDVWKAVDLKQWRSNYQEYVDLIMFYSYIIYFYNTYKKPICLISGNHDCYSGPYGMPPYAIEFLRIMGNEGIPADHNLTFYESYILCGPSVNEIVDKSLFEEERFRWFFSIFTPFSDFVLPLGDKQLLVGLGWGNGEDTLDIIAGQGRTAGVGHLPRAKESISDDQLELLTQLELSNPKSDDSKMKVILATHFTFVSHEDDVPQNSTVELPIFPSGDITMAPIPIGEGVFYQPQKYTHADWGTFQDNRPKLYFDYLAAGKIQCVLTGHSHRRGIYTIKENKNVFPPIVMSRSHVFDNIKNEIGQLQGKCSVIVSDSAGPIPRFNLIDEFNGWGSDTPSGTKVTFDSTSGNIQNIAKFQCSQNTAKPRFAVVFDYLNSFVPKKDFSYSHDIHGLYDGEKNICSAKLGPYKFLFFLPSSLGNYVDIEKAVLFLFDKRHKSWRKMELKANSYKTSKGGYIFFFVMDSDHMDFLYDIFIEQKESDSKMYEDSPNYTFEVQPNVEIDREQYAIYHCYLSLKFKISPRCKESAEILSQYNFESYWNSKCVVRFKYIISKDNEHPDAYIKIFTDVDIYKNRSVNFSEIYNPTEGTSGSEK
jgi:hypothetical protein